MDTIKYNELLVGYCFTYAYIDALVYYEDTQKDDSKRHFHSYKNGKLFTSTATFPTNKDFYYCTVNGEPIPLITIVTIHNLRMKIKALEKQIVINKLPTGYIK